MSDYRITAHGAEETRKLGEEFGKRLPAGSLVTLSGELGAGKTTFTQGLARGLGIRRKVTSPTFTLVREYHEGRLPLYHIDAYRLENIVQDLGFEDYISGDGICVIEWAKFVPYLLPEERLQIELYINEDDSREIIITPIGEKYKEVAETVCTL